MLPEDQVVLDETGALHVAGGAMQFIEGLKAALARWPDGQSGTRIFGDPEIRQLLNEPCPIASLVARLVGKPVWPVRSIYFDKNDNSNWALGWHQDRTIAVAERHEIPGFGPWTIKQGILHVQPPFAVIAGLRTVRIHLDPVPANNGPLRVIPGSHRLGQIATDRYREIAGTQPVTTCLANRGDVWVYHTPILHASDRSSPGQRRRVLQVDYASESLPAPLEWLGI